MNLAHVVMIVTPLWCIVYVLVKITKQLANLTIMLGLLRREIELVGKGD